jgi:hypothetical protein
MNGLTFISYYPNSDCVKFTYGRETEQLPISKQRCDNCSEHQPQMSLRQWFNQKGISAHIELEICDSSGRITDGSRKFITRNSTNIRGINMSFAETWRYLPSVTYISTYLLTHALSTGKLTINQETGDARNSFAQGRTRNFRTPNMKLTHHSYLADGGMR